MMARSPDLTHTGAQLCGKPWPCRACTSEPVILQGSDFRFQGARVTGLKSTGSEMSH